MKLNRKYIGLLAALLCMTAVIDSCDNKNRETSIGDVQKEEPAYQDNLNAISPSGYNHTQGLRLAPGTYISMIGKDETSAFWSTVKEGIMQAADDLNETLGYKGEDKIKVTYNAPRGSEDIDEQVNILDEELARYPDVIGIASIDAKACTVQFDLAAENGIPVIAMDSGNNYEGILCTVGTDNADAAHTGAYKLADEIGKKGQILLLVHSEKTTTGKVRMEGFLEKLKKSYPDISVVQILFCDELEQEKILIAKEKNKDLKGADTLSPEDLSDEDVVQYYLEKYPRIKGIFGTNNTSTQLALETLRQMDKTDDLVLMGFDAGKDQLDALKKGEIRGLVVQNPFGIGYASVVAAARTVLGLGNQEEVNTGYLWVTQENLESESIQKMLYE